MQFLDKFLEALSPSLALAREEKRVQLAQLRVMTDLYRAAQWDRSFSSWDALGTDANTEIGSQVARIRNRARDLGRNNPYISRAYSVLSAKLIGKGVRPRIAAEVSSQVRNRTLSAWQEWVETCDLDGQQDLYGLQLLAVRTMIESGEALVQFVSVPDQRIPWKIRILEPDMVDMSIHQQVTPGGNIIIHGVEFNSAGQRVAYHMYDEHPGSDIITGNTLSTRRIPAEFIAPLYRQDRPDQVHGVPWVASVAPLVQHLDDLMDTILKKEKIQACFAAFVRTRNRLKARSEAGLIPNQGLTRTEQISPARIDYLDGDEEITFANPPAGTNSSEYHTKVLHAIAVGMGVTYAQLTGDLNNTSYSSSRTGGLDQWSLLDQWQHLLIKPMLLAPIWDKFEFANALRQKRGAFLRVEWDFPDRELLDPEKDGKAKDDALASGRKTFHQVIQETGRDPVAHIEEMIRERELFKEEELTFSWLGGGGGGIVQSPQNQNPNQNQPQTPSQDNEEQPTTPQDGTRSWLIN